MVDAAVIVAGTSIFSLIISRVRCILRPGQTPCFQSGCSDTPLEHRDDSEIVVHKQCVGGHEVLVIAQKND